MQKPINRFAKKTPLELAFEVAQKYINRPFIDQKGDGKDVIKIKDILVTIPDQAVYLNTKAEEIADHAQRKGLQIVSVMENGKVITGQEEDLEFDEKMQKHINSLKKRADKVGLPENSTEEEILAAERKKRK